MDAGVSTKGLRVAGVPIRDDAWVTNFVDEKVEAVILDVGKINHVLTDGHIHSSARTRALISLPATHPRPSFPSPLGG